MSQKWVFRPRENERAAARLFCFPSAGFGASMYRDWTDVLPNRVEICGVRYPGRETQLCEAPIDDLQALVAAIADGLAPLLDRPFAFFGHSMGAWVAFELTRHMRRIGGPEPFSLFASARRAPHLPERHAVLTGLDDEMLIHEIHERFGGVPEAVLAEPELLAIMVPILRADLTSLDRYVYRHEEPLTTPIFASGGDSDPEVTCGDLEAWAEQTSGDYRRQIFSGSHFYLNQHSGADLRGYIAQQIECRLRGS